MDNKNNIKTRLVRIIKDSFAEFDLDESSIQAIDLIEDLGMDSVTFITIVIQIEEEFKITIPDELLLMENFKNINLIMHFFDL